MPAIRHFHPSDVSTPTSSAATTPTDDDDSLLICTCPTISPPLDRTPILISKTSEKKRVRVRRTKNNNNNNQDHHHIPRPRNAFIIFRSHYINFLKSKHDSDTERPEDPDTKPTTSSAEYQQNELSKIAAKVWNNMDPDERKPYSEEARKEKEWHKRMYPDYVYRAPNTSSATANAEKVKGFKIKVKTGNPSKSKKSPSPPRQEHPLSDIEFVSVQPLQWQETPSLQTTHVTEHEFVPTECIPPLDLHASHQECQQESDLKPEHCPPQQPTFAVDLSPRSLAYDQYQAYNALSSSSSGFVFPDDPFPLTYEYGMIDPLVFGSSFFNVPSHGIDEGIQATIGDPFSYPSSFGAGPVFFPSVLPYPSFDCDLLPPVGAPDKVLPLDLDLDVPGFNFNFELGEKMMMMKDDDLRCSLATWAGYE